MPTLQVITVSTRPSRQGPLVAAWLLEQCRRHSGLTVEPIDLAEVALPMMDEPNHPRLRQYTHEHTKAWSRTIDRADAYVFVTPEYNHGTPPSLVNALSYLQREWAYKPCAFVSYGGASGGLRSVQMTKQIAASLRMMPIPEGVSFTFFAKEIDGTGEFKPPEAQEKAADAMLHELGRWAEALASLRR